MDRSARIAAVVAEVEQVLQRGLEQVWDAGLDRDLGRIEGQVQQVLRQAGGRILVGLAQAQVATMEQCRPSCAQCARGLRRVGRRPRYLLGRVGEARVERPYSQCAHCGTGVSPLDAVGGWAGAY